MSTLLDLIDYFIILCDVAAAARILYCFIRMSAEPDEAKSYTRKIINIFIFLVLANTALATMLMVKKYVK